MKDSLGDRMKHNYEDRYRIKLTRRTPVILRLDGNCFSSLTKTCAVPFDKYFHHCMTTTAETVMKKSQGAKCCYIQSDEISILLTDCDSLTTEAWFDYNLQKMVSISAGIASATFSGMFYEFGWFDCRVFNVPVEEVCNYFIWRQKDWIRNSISMLARSHFSHSELMNKNTSDMHEMLYTKNVNWADLELQWKNGTLITKEGRFHPIFTEDRSIIENLLKVQE